VNIRACLAATGTSAAENVFVIFGSGRANSRPATELVKILNKIFCVVDTEFIIVVL